MRSQRALALRPPFAAPRSQGFVYFDVHRKLICCNAFVTMQTETVLTLAGPFQPAEKTIEYLRQSNRLRKRVKAPFSPIIVNVLPWVLHAYWSFYIRIKVKTV